ncbi:hypothetical protein L7F22_046405 [Adiantum nelumboides]|nr:hypothetical protein [Adiantum nelumboides]
MWVVLIMEKRGAGDVMRDDRTDLRVIDNADQEKLSMLLSSSSPAAPAARPHHHHHKRLQEASSDSGDGADDDDDDDDDNEAKLERNPALISLDAVINGGLHQLLHMATLQHTNIRHLIDSIRFSSSCKDGEEELRPCYSSSDCCCSAHLLHSQLLLQIAHLKERIECVNRELVCVKARNSELQSRLALAMHKRETNTL